MNHSLHLLASLDESLPPSVELLVNAIQAILSPTPEYTQLHDLLRLLTMVEFWRMRAMSVASAALVWQAYYMQVTPSDQSILLLDEHEEHFLADHEENSSTWRQIFITIIATCISTHLLRLWLDHENPESHSLFWVYWNEYFKALENPAFPKNQHPENHLHSDSQLLAQRDISHPVQPFHHRLSISDIDQLLASLQALVNSISRPEDHPRHSISHDEPRPSPTLDDNFIILINDYLQYVLPLVNEVHSLFPNELPLPS